MLFDTLRSQIDTLLDSREWVNSTAAERIFMLRASILNSPERAGQHLTGYLHDALSPRAQRVWIATKQAYHAGKVFAASAKTRTYYAVVEHAGQYQVYAYNATQVPMRSGQTMGDIESQLPRYYHQLTLVDAHHSDYYNHIAVAECQMQANYCNLQARICLQGLHGIACVTPQKYELLAKLDTCMPFIRCTPTEVDNLSVDIIETCDGLGNLALTADQHSLMVFEDISSHYENMLDSYYMMSHSL